MKEVVSSLCILSAVVGSMVTQSCFAQSSALTVRMGNDARTVSYKIVDAQSAKVGSVALTNFSCS